MLFTAPSIDACTSVDVHVPTMRRTKAPSAPLPTTDAHPAVSVHDTRDDGTGNCSTCPSEKRTSISSVSAAVTGAPRQYVAMSPPVRARHPAPPSDRTALSTALTTSGTSMNALTEPLSAGHTASATVATSPQKYSGSGCTVSRALPLTASDGCVTFTTTSASPTGSVLPSANTSMPYTSAPWPSAVSDCSRRADADCAVAPLNAPLVTAYARSSTPSTNESDTISCAYDTPATSTPYVPLAVGRSVRSAASYTSPVPPIAASAVTSTPSAMTRTRVLWYRAPHSLDSSVLDSSTLTLAGVYAFMRTVVLNPP